MIPTIQALLALDRKNPAQDGRTREGESRVGPSEIGAQCAIRKSAPRSAVIREGLLMLNKIVTDNMAAVASISWGNFAWYFWRLV